MPDNSSNRATMRLDGHRARLFFGVWLGSAVLVGTLTADASNGDLAFAYTTVSGNSANVRRAYKIVITDTATGAFKYETSVRSFGTINSTSMPCREFGRGAALVESGDTMTVYSVVVPTDKLVSATSGFLPDYTTYTNQNGVLSPMCCSGGAYMDYLPTGTTTVDVSFQGDLAYFIDDDSNGPINHSYTASTATGSTSSTSANPTFTFTAGYHIVVHTATDADNSATHTQVVPVMIYDDDNPPYEVAEADLTLDIETGASARWRLFDDAERATLPDGAMGCLFLRETYNNSEQSFGNAVESRSHMKWVGFLSSTEFSIDNPIGGENPIYFSGISPLQKLLNLAGFSKVLLDDASPADWSELEALTTLRAILQIARWYTTFCEVFDFTVGTYVNYEYPRLYVQKSSAGEQIKEIADATDARLTCDRVGRFILGTAIEYSPLADHNNYDTTLTIAADDYDATGGGIRVYYDHFSTHGTIEARALSGGASPTAFFSRWPGVPGTGTQDVVFERWICDPSDSQNDTNQRAGDRAAAMFGIFIDASGIQQRAYDVDIPLLGAYDVIDPAYQEWVEIGLDETTNRRGIDLSASYHQPRTVNIRYNEDGTASSTLTARSETSARNGVTYHPPTNATTPPYDPPDNDFVPPVITFPPAASIQAVQLYKGTQRIALIGTSGIARTFNFGSGAATTWEYTTNASLSISGSPALWSPDGFAPGKGLELTSTRLYYLDLTTTPPSVVGGTHRLTLAADNNRGLDMSFGQQGVAGIIEHLGGSTTTYVSTDNFATAPVTTVVGTEAGTVTNPLGFFMSARVPGRVYAHRWTAGGEIEGRESLDYGATYGALAIPNFTTGDGEENMIGALHIPHDQSSDELIAYWTIDTGVSRLYRDDGSGTPVDISPSAASIFCHARGGISTYVGNRNKALLVTNAGIVYGSNNFAATTPTYTTLSVASSYRRGAIAGDNPNTFYLWGASNAVALVTDGTTIVSQVGDLTSSIGEIKGLAGF